MGWIETVLWNLYIAGALQEAYDLGHAHGVLSPWEA